MDGSGTSPQGRRARRGTHATARGDGVLRVLVWTVLGTILPGSGLIVAGRRVLGGVVLAVVALGAFGAAAWWFLGDPVVQGISFALDPQRLLVLAVAGAVGGALWVALVVLTSHQLRRQVLLTAVQNGLRWLLVAALVVGVAVPAYKVSDYALITRGVVTSKDVFGGVADAPATVTKPDVAKADPWAGKGRINVLLIGSDAGSDRTGTRPDTLILASIEPRTGATVLLSLPRNLERVPFPAGTPGSQAWPDGFFCPTVGKGHECLLNAIWTWASAGEGLSLYRNAQNPGLRATEDAVQGVTGLKVDTYVSLNLQGFIDFVDAIGGITVDVHDRLPIGGNGDEYSAEYHKAVGGWIEVGDDQHFNGYYALWFARSRWATDDFNRMQRQRCVIGDVVDQADPVTLALNFPAIAATLRKNLTTGIPPSDLQAWVVLAQRIQKAGVRSLVFDPQVIDVADPDYDEIHRLVAEAVAPEAAPTATPSATASASASATPSTSPNATPTPDPKAATDLKAVC